MSIVRPQTVIELLRRTGSIDAMDSSVSPGLMIQNYAAAQRSLRVAVVTETYPPEVNGVAMTLARMVEGLHRRNHDVQLIRPQQDGRETAECGVRFHEVLTRGLPIPRYPNLRMGVPSKRTLVRLWGRHRPDVVHIATEGPLGWSALQAALHLKLPVSSDFRTNFHAYSEHYGIGWLCKPIMAYLRKFHNRTQCTMVPTDALQRELEASGFRRLAVVTRGVDTLQFAPQRRSDALRAQWGVGATDLVVACVGRLAPEKNLGTLCNRVRGHPQRRCACQVGDRWRRTAARPTASALPERGVRWPADRRRPGCALCVGRPVSVSEPDRNLRQRHHRGDGQRPAGGGVRLRRGSPVDPLRQERRARAVCRLPAFVRHALALACDSALRRAIGEQARRSACELDWDGIAARFEGVLAAVIRQVAAPAEAPRTAALHHLA